MKKMKTIPFDLAMAKAIHEGKLEGEIVTRQGTPVEILGFDVNLIDGDIAFITRCLANGERVFESVFGSGFKYLGHDESPYDLMLRVPDDTPPFKPFDKVLVRNRGWEKWVCNLFSNVGSNELYPYICMDACYAECIPYEGNEKLLGTSNEPKNK